MPNILLILLVGTAHAAGSVSVVPSPHRHSQAQSPGVIAEDADVQQALEDQKKLQKVTAEINRFNPFSDETKTAQETQSALASESLAPSDPRVRDAMSKLQGILANPAVQSYLRLFSNPNFAKGTEQVIQSPMRGTLLWVELGLFVLFVIFRAWRLSKVDHWARRLWVRTYTFGLYAVLGLIGAPALVLGSSFLGVLYGAFQIFRGSS